MRFHFHTRGERSPFMYIFAEPMTEEQADEIQSRSEIANKKYERDVIGVDRSEQELQEEWQDIQHSVDERVDLAEIGDVKDEGKEQVPEEENTDGEERNDGVEESSSDVEDANSNENELKDEHDDVEVEEDESEDEAVETEEEESEDEAVEVEEDEPEDAAGEVQEWRAEDRVLKAPSAVQEFGHQEAGEVLTHLVSLVHVSVQKVVSAKPSQNVGAGEAELTSSTLTARSTSQHQPGCLERSPSPRYRSHRTRTRPSD